MSSSIKRGLCWALTALQTSPESIQTDLSDHDISKDRSVLDVIQSVLPVTALKSSGGHQVQPEDTENKRPTYSRTEVADHCWEGSCWIVINNKVYDITRFLRLHPGGQDIMMEHGGHDATSAFIDKGHSRDAFEMLSEYCIGEVTRADWFPEKEYT